MCEKAEAAEVDRGNYNIFDPQKYLNQVFQDVTVIQDVAAFVEFFSQFPDNSLTVLDYGGGPNVFPLIVGAEKTRRYVHSDYAKPNRDEVERWKKSDPQAFAWRENIRRCLKAEGKAGTNEEVLRREERMRGALEAVVPCDAKSDRPVAQGYEGPYDVVTCSFCLECVFASMETLAEAVGRISNLVKPGGYFVLVVSSVDETEETPYFLVDQVSIAGFKYDGFLVAPSRAYADALKANGYAVVRHIVRPYRHPELNIDDFCGIFFGKKEVN